MSADDSTKGGGLATKLAGAFAGLSLGLGIACVVLAQRSGGGGGGDGTLDPELQAELLAGLAAKAKVIFDSHPDADVGRVLLPNLDGLEFSGVPIRSNSFGLREREYELPKPEGLVRVVLLGDSFVFGYGVQEEERAGVHLERWLEERLGVEGQDVEVLHIGVGSWGVVEECEYLRRQLSDLRPDLVLHLVVTNDLDDNSGVRGQGVRSSFSPRHRARADSMVFQSFPPQFTARGGFATLLLDGVDHESRTRHELAAQRVVRLREAVERCGGRYVFLPQWSNHKARLMRFFWDALPEQCLAPLPNAYYLDRENWNSPEDSHWNRAGHERYARFLYGLIRARDLLPSLALAPWAEADEQFARDATVGLEEARTEPPHGWIAGRRVSPLIDFLQLTPELLNQVYGGIDEKGMASPYASLVLENFAGGRLLVRGSCLARPEIEGARVRVWVEEFELGSFELRSDAPIELDYDLPEALDERDYLNVRFESDDWVYTGPGLRSCKSYWLRAVAIAPPE